MTSQGDNRSVTARDITGSSIVTGDRDTVSTRMTQHTLPLPESVDAGAEVAALRDLLDGLKVPERGKLDRALQDAAEETAKADPDKEDAAGAVGRIVRYAKAADDFSGHTDKIVPRLAALAAWLGVHGQPILSALGLG